jgi:2,3-diketo-5-methylthio-1-phosphopentane phosphatase
MLLDIEGTTTSIQFVYDILFPYARQRLASYLGEHFHEPGVQADIAAFRAQAQVDREAGLEVPAIPESGEDEIKRAVAASALLQMDQDRKVGPLKSLQGRIWEDGYRSGHIKGQIFADVVPALARWKAAGVPVYIYSSGSVLAQKLLFGHSQKGDLTPFLAGYFDTAVGPKREAASYAAIAASIGTSGLFATDVLAEAQAAAQAGWQAVIMNRPGNAPLAAHDFPVLQDFNSL